jgi:predicted esterase
MSTFRFFLAAVFVFSAQALVFCQSYDPPPAKPPDDATLNTIAAKIQKLDEALGTLRMQGVKDPVLAEIEIYHKAAAWIVRHNEFYHADAGAWTLAVLDRGLLRAQQAAGGEAPWHQQFGWPVVRAYRSRIDGSVQPFAVTFPADYDKDRQKKWHLDVVLHGRDPSLTEVKFLQQFSGNRLAAKDQAFIRLEIFGRGNNAYRWAGETDVFEATDAFVAVERMFGRDQHLDPARVVLRGFSMGGAGTWHLGLHRPDRWCVLGPGAGFTATHGYVKDLPDKLPPDQEACLRIYDAVDYAENAFNVPVVAYAGSDDPQLAAARNIEARLQPLKIPMTLLIAPGLGHSFPPEWQQKAEAEYAKYSAPGKGRNEYPPRVHFVTYTLKYPSCAWVEILGLEQHYDRALVDAEKTDAGFTIKAANVRTLHLGMPAGSVAPFVVHIDGQQVQARPYITPLGSPNVYLEKRNGQWLTALPQKLVTDRLRQIQKITGLQGPIDDAFTDSFLCVRGTGKAWHSATANYAEANLRRFQEEWDKYLRADLPVKDDVEITDEDIATKHLILFGDPGSNSLMAHVLDGLPLKWTQETITLGNQTYTAPDHVPVLIYPSPLNTGRYVVLNSGHTFHSTDFRGTNALLFPRLGDYAILKLAPEKDPLAAEVVTAGLFDDFWRIKK